MALKLNERYPGRFDNPTSEYPQGSFKNRSAPGAQDGTYLEKDWANDHLAFFSSLLDAAGLTANGQVDEVGACQTFDSLLQVIQDNAANAPVVFNASGTYTPTPGLKFAYVEVQGGGGAGGPAAVTAAGQFSMGGGGASGAFARGVLTAAQIGASQAITIGAGGVGSTANVGNVGTATSIGALITASGGQGGVGSGAVASGSTFVAVGGSAGLASTGGTLLNASGQSGATGFATGVGLISGPGAGSGISGGQGGGNAAGGGISGGNGSAPGAGGGGSANNVSTATIRQGGSGANGLVLIWEFF